MKHKGKLGIVFLWGVAVLSMVLLCLWVEDASAEEVNDKPAPEKVMFNKEANPIEKQESFEDECYYEESAYYEDQVYYEEPVYYDYTGYSGGSADDFQTAGVVYDGGTMYTWYSENVLPGGGLDIPGRTVNEDGYVTDGDGNLCVASSDYDYGTHLDTPFGEAVVYDSGCASGTVDVYTSW